MEINHGFTESYDFVGGVCLLWERDSSKVLAVHRLVLHTTWVCYNIKCDKCKAKHSCPFNITNSVELDKDYLTPLPTLLTRT